MQYDKEINSIAINIIADLKAGQQDPSDIYSAVHEYVDGHQWIIYTSYHRQIIQYTPNADAYKDVYSDEDLGQLVSEQGIEAFEQVRAFFAMTQDVSEAMQELKSELENELEKLQDEHETLQDEINDSAILTQSDEYIQEKGERFDALEEQINLLETIIEGL
jgi:predicted ribosome quality control (RQC) complex YloA/Tae2 family protein